MLWSKSNTHWVSSVLFAGLKTLYADRSKHVPKFLAMNAYNK